MIMLLATLKHNYVFKWSSRFQLHLGFLDKYFETVPSTKFHGTLSSGSRADTWRHDRKVLSVTMQMCLRTAFLHYKINHNKTDCSIRCELQNECILDKIRRIQTELAFTLAKNATKPNPFGIISLQTTRKENNWKTEDTLARAVVTLETERIKGSNPWCLWW
jgi:hypothetical protein